MLRGDFKFDAANHVYTVGDRRVPAIGQVLRADGHVWDGWYGDEPMERGKAVHLATLQFDLGASAEACLVALPLQWRGYFQAYLKFVRSVGSVMWEVLEEPLLDRYRKFAGTPDRIGLVNRLPTVLEIKTGGKAKWHGLQTAAQTVLMGDATGARYRRRVVYLQETGQFKLVGCEDAGDFLRFYEALHRYHKGGHHE